MEYDFIQMAASAGLAVRHALGPIFEYIFDCMQLYFSYGSTNVVLQSLNCLWLVHITLIFDGPQR